MSVLVAGQTAVCINCGPLPVEQFYRNGGSGTPRKRCKICDRALQLERHKKIRATNPRRITEWVTRRRYGIELTDYEERLRRQDFRCAMCDRHHSEFKKGLGLDHNHSTGQVRDFLCPGCNSLVASLEHPLLPLAQAYLEQHND